MKDISIIRAPKGAFLEVNPFLYYVHVIDGSRENFRSFLLNKGIDTGIHWQAGHDFSFFSECKRGSLNITNKISKEIVSLPLHSNMSEGDIDYITDVIKGYAKKHEL